MGAMYHADADCVADQRISCLAGMAMGLIHEINNCVGAIINNVSYIEATHAIAAPAGEQLHHIQCSAKRLSSLADVLKRYTRDFVIEMEPLNARDPLDQAIAQLRPSWPSSIKIDYQAPAGNVYVLSNRMLLQEAYVALLNNAYESLPEKGGRMSICMQTPAHPFQGQADLTLGNPPPAANAMSIRIKDNGCGIAAGEINRIFDPFFTTKMRANGLGLAAVVGLVTHTNAALQVQSAPERGSSFLLHLPVVR